MSGLAVPIPYQWQVGDTGNAALLNAQLFSGLTFLLNPPLAVLKITTVQAALANSAFVAMQFDTTVSDTYSGHSNTVNNTRYTAQVTGWYWVRGCASFAVPNTTGNRGLQLAVNGTLQAYAFTILPANATANFGGYEVNAPVFLNAGDYVELQAFQSSGGALSLNANGCNMSLFWMHA